MHGVPFLRGVVPVPPVPAVDAVPQRQQVEDQQGSDDHERYQHVDHRPFFVALRI
jgi:hypothetical protein